MRKLERLQKYALNYLYIKVSSTHSSTNKLFFFSERFQRNPWTTLTELYLKHKTYGVFTPEQDTDKTNVEPVHSYEAFHTRSDKPGVKGIIGMHRFNICLVVLSLSCSGVKTPLLGRRVPVASRLSHTCSIWFMLCECKILTLFAS